VSAGIPVRLSTELAARARAAASTQERSLTEQVEHWARIGQAVEDAVMSATVQRLKARSHDEMLDERIAVSMTKDGRAKALALIQRRNATTYGVDASGAIRAVRSRPRRHR